MLSGGRTQPLEFLILQEQQVRRMTLKQAADGVEYTIAEVNVDDEELSSFLFSLGCYKGAKITMVMHLKGSCVVYIKNGRYSIDNRLSDLIEISS